MQIAFVINRSNARLSYVLINGLLGLPHLAFEDGVCRHRREMTGMITQPGTYIARLGRKHEDHGPLSLDTNSAQAVPDRRASSAEMFFCSWRRSCSSGNQ